MERGEGSSTNVRSLAKSMREQLDKMTQSSSFRCIYTVPKLLREANEDAYTPKLLSIGPFHHKRCEGLIPMEAKKFKYLRSFLNAPQIDGKELDKYLDIVVNSIYRIRASYTEKILCDDDQHFIPMVLLDSVFIIQLLRQNYNNSLTRQSIGMPMEVKEYARDIMLAENQLPFFILHDLYEAAFRTDPNPHLAIPSFTDIARKFLGLDAVRFQDSDAQMMSSCCHLLDFLRIHYLPCNPKHTLNNEKDHPHMICPTANADIDHQQMICPTATSLCEAGIKFQVNDAPFSRLLDVLFDPEKGILSFPKLKMDDQTETLFRNLVAFEQSHRKIDTHFIDYLFFLDCLINTPKDVELLTKAGIIENWLGSEKTLSVLFNSMGRHAYSFSNGYFYADLTKALNSYHNEKWNRYKATLMQVYFCHPWAMIPVIYAIFLFIFTLIQAVASILAVPGLLKGPKSNQQ